MASELRIYNTLTRQKEPFQPLVPPKVRIYTCGLTVQDYCHIGHARMDLIWDMIKRYLRHRGYQVYHVQNFTDINEKIAAKALDAGVDPLAWAERFIQEYHADMKALGIEGADLYCRVTENMQAIIDMIAALIERGFAYESQGNVYFRVAACRDYGKLSGRRVEEMQAGARLAVEGSKENPADFALWTVAQPGEPTWDSPWGPGTPGWHIECSAMSTKFLGQSYDMHGGGVDIIFPHHENELAQAECATGAPYVKYWLHHGMVTLPGGEKMSKSLNNFFRVRDVLLKVPADALRFFVLSTHYRSPIAFSEELVEQSRTAMARIANTVAAVRQAAGRSNSQEDERDLAEAVNNAADRFEDAMSDDFNSAEAIGVMFDIGRQVNTHLALSSGLSQETARLILDLYQSWGDILGISGTLFQDDQPQSLDNEIESLIAKRTQARQAKDWGTADQIRQQLDAMGIVLIDTPQGVKWKRK